MSRSGIKTIGITMGDPTGVGPEVIIKALKVKGLAKASRFICIGDAEILRGVPAEIIPIAYRTPGEGALKFLQRGVRMIKDKTLDALVTAPLSKEAVSRYSPGFLGHTEYLARAFKVKKFDMMFIYDRMRLSLVTRHVPLKEVPRLITKRAVLSSIELMQETLQKHFHIARPRIAVLGVNPHAGEGGLLGKEEGAQIIPAIKSARSQGIQANGPFPADTFFCQDRDFDGIVAMYHDQGLAPVKGLYFKDLVNFTAGLPFVRTSPVHGTALDIAGKGLADPSSMIAAIKLACRLA